MLSFRKLREASVFARMPSGVDPRDALVMFFHRASATKYLVIALWGIASVIFGVNTFIIIWDRNLQIVYSSIVAITSILACVGATFYDKKRAKGLELFAGSSVLALITVYPFALMARAISQSDRMVLPLMVLAFGLIILPACRTFFIFKWGEL